MNHFCKLFPIIFELRNINSVMPVWLLSGAAGSVYKECMINGAWKTEENSSSVWRNQSECENQYYFKSEVNIARTH